MQDAEICDVKVSKGTAVYIDIGKITLIIFIASNHFNPKKWHDPNRFIPERFDQNSEYYFKPGSEDVRDSSAFIPFSIGARRCPGDAYALNAMKALVAYTVLRIEYTIDKEVLKDDLYHIGLEGEETLPGKIIKKFN